MRRTVYGVVFIAILFTGMAVSSAISGSKGSAEPNPVSMVWSSAHGKGLAVLFSMKKNDQWSDPVKLSDKEPLNVAPSLTEDGNGRTWVVWSSLKGEESYLYLSVFDGKAWSKPERIETEFSTNTGPSIVVDNNGVLRLFWAAFDGQDDEILTSYWNGSSFEAPVRITDNAVPDVLPVSGNSKDSGIVWVKWKHYTDQGYKDAFSTLSAKDWGDMQLIDDIGQDGTEQPFTDHDTAEMISDLDLPPDVLLENTVSFHLKNAVIQSFPLRLILEEK